MGLEEQTKIKKTSKTRGKRFYTALDMAILKKDIATYNAKRKRGEVPNHPNAYISQCGCGNEGCFIHGTFETTKKNFYRL